MKLYKRQVRPYMFVPGCQGWRDIHDPMIVDGKEWHEEEEEDRLRELLETTVKEKDPWGTLKFDERYIEVGNPELTISVDEIDKNTYKQLVERALSIAKRGQNNGRMEGNP